MSHKRARLFGDFKAAPDIRETRAGCRWRLCTAQDARGQGL